MSIQPSVIEERPSAAIDRSDMRWIPGGTFRMGSDSHYPEERPVHRVTVSGFWIDRAPVTNRLFRRFVEETGHLTFAELPPQASDYPGAHPELLYPGSLVFTKPPYRVNLTDCHNWWSFRLGADWRHPEGAESSIDGLDDHPVVHVTAADAEAYAPGPEEPFRPKPNGSARRVAVSMVPSMPGATNFCLGIGSWRTPGKGLSVAEPRNRWLRGYVAGRCVSPNGYGLLDMIGNVWEWTADWFVSPPGRCGESVLHSFDPRGGAHEASHDPAHAQLPIARRVLKGGSHLCAPNYCRRYRPAARHPQPIDTSTCHVGFRCVVRAAR